VFTKSTGQWRARVIPEDEIREFRQKVESFVQHPPFAHASYLINAAAAEDVLFERSITSLDEELSRVEALGLSALVLHPGAYTCGTEERGLERIAAGVTTVLRRHRGGRALILFEHTAGQGTCLGHRFEHLRRLLELLDGSPRIGVCLDTCHLLAAGYDIASEAGYAETFADFERLVGLDRLKALHLNDSKKPCGCRVDRHEHIGKGCVGLEGFRRIVNDARFAHLPMVIETPKAAGRTGEPLDNDPLDRANIRRLRALINGSRPTGRTRR
jgi:deoxyribonuclease-4